MLSAYTHSATHIAEEHKSPTKKTQSIHYLLILWASETWDWARGGAHPGQAPGVQCSEMESENKNNQKVKLTNANCSWFGRISMWKKKAIQSGKNTSEVVQLWNRLLLDWSIVDFPFSRLWQVTQ